MKVFMSFAIKKKKKKNYDSKYRHFLWELANKDKTIQCIFDTSSIACISHTDGWTQTDASNAHWHVHCHILDSAKTAFGLVSFVSMAK